MCTADRAQPLRPSNRAMVEAKRNAGRFMRDLMSFPFRNVDGNGSMGINQPFCGGFEGTHAKGTSALGDRHSPWTASPSRPLNEHSDCGSTFAQASMASRGGRPARSPCPTGVDCATEKLWSNGAARLSDFSVCCGLRTDRSEFS